MHDSGPQLPNVRSRLASAAVDRARQERLQLASSGQDALGDLVTQAVDRLADEELLGDDDAIARAEASLIRVVDELAIHRSPSRERHDLGERTSKSPDVDEAAVQQVVAGLCPGFWPFC